MGDYESEQKRIKKLWDDIMSDEDSEPSLIGDVYSSEGYSPGSHVSSDTENEDSDESLFIIYEYYKYYEGFWCIHEPSQFLCIK